MRLPGSFTVMAVLLPCMGCVAPTDQAATRQAPQALDATHRTEVLIRLGDDMRRNGQPADALAFYRAASHATSRDPMPLQRMEDALMDLHDPARAEQAFRGELAIDPGNAAAERGLAGALLAQNRAAEALPILQRLGEGTADPNLLRTIGTALDMVGQPDAAQAVYRRGLHLDPIDADLHGNLALSLALSGQAAAAVSEMQAAIASPDPDPRQAANAVLVLALTGNTATAEARGNATIGAATTQALLARAQQALAATDPRARAAAVGMLTGTSPGQVPLASTLLPSPATAVALTAPPGQTPGQTTAADPPARPASRQPRPPNPTPPPNRTPQTDPTPSPLPAPH